MPQQRIFWKVGFLLWLLYHTPGDQGCGEVPCFSLYSSLSFLHYLPMGTCTHRLGLPHFVSLLSYLTLFYLIPQRSVTFCFLLT